MNDSRVLPRLALVLSSGALVAAIACSGAGSPTGPTDTPITVTGTGITTYTYTHDIQPIVAASCITCHGPSVQQAGLNFSTYEGVLGAVTVGSDTSLLVRVTQPGGLMYNNLPGDKNQKAGIIYDWVVNSHASR